MSMKLWTIGAAAVIIASGIIFFLTKKPAVAPVMTSNVNTTLKTNTTVNANSTVTAPVVNENIAPSALPSVVVPINGFFTRITKKPFGIYITPATSPVQPEKFTGYHTGADAETTPAEQNIDVPIMAIANGTVVFAGHVNGYGGVVIVEHKIGAEKVTALYGHVRQSSITVKAGDNIHPGDRLAVLGTGYTSETDGERKHLHLGLLKGYVINYKGYVQTQGALSAWEDPVAWLQAHGAT